MTQEPRHARQILRAVNPDASGLTPLLILVICGITAAGGRGQATRPEKTQDLTAEAAALTRAALDRLGEGYQARTDVRRHIVYVSAVDKKALAHVMKLLGTFHDIQRKALFPKALRRNVTVVLPTVEDYRKLVPHVKAHGIYRRRNRTLVSISFSNVLIHEFTHALHHNDQVSAGQKHSIWIVEGLATLYQSSRFKDDRMEILTAGGLSAIQKLLKQNKTRSLAELCSMTQKAFMQDAESCYLQVRYVMLYLHRLGKLQQFYEAYKAGYEADRTGAAALEKTLGKPLKRIEADWRKWALSRKPPWRPGYERQAHLGVRMQKAAEGVKITGFVRNSTAQRAGLLKVGDVIISLAGQSVHSARDLAAAVQSCKPGHIVDLEVIRDGRTVRIKHLLGLMPK